MFDFSLAVLSRQYSPNNHYQALWETAEKKKKKKEHFWNHFLSPNAVSAGIGNNEGAAGLLSAIIVPGSLSA